MVVDIEHKGVGLAFKAAGNPIRMFETEEGRYFSPPLLGEHTEAVLKDLLGYDDKKIERLLRKEALRRAAGGHGTSPD